MTTATKKPAAATTKPKAATAKRPPVGPAPFSAQVGVCEELPALRAKRTLNSVRNEKSHHSDVK